MGYMAGGTLATRPFLYHCRKAAGGLLLGVCYLRSIGATPLIHWLVMLAPLRASDMLVLQYLA